MADDDSYSSESDDDSSHSSEADDDSHSSEAMKLQKQLGTVKIEHGLQYLYEVNHIDPNRPSIVRGDPVMVSVKAPFLRLEEIDIQFDLFCGAYKADICVTWENYHSDGVTKGKCSIESPAYNGDICFQYGLFTNASVANLELQLKKSGSSQVYGFVSASNSRLDHPSCASILFWKRPEYKIQVGENEVIPFSKSCVGVPLDSKFFVCVALNCDGQVYDASFTLDPNTKELQNL